MLLYIVQIAQIVIISQIPNQGAWCCSLWVLYESVSRNYI